MTGPRRNVPELTCHILDTGHCLAHEHILIQGERARSRLPFDVALLGHPQHGWLLWDAAMRRTCSRPRRTFRTRSTGSLRRCACVPSWPLWRSWAASTWCQRHRHDPHPHFHADHIAGLADFPASRLSPCVRRMEVWPRSGPAGAAPRLLRPACCRVTLRRAVTLLDAFTGPALPGLGATYDYDGDASLLLVRRPGYARGQFGLLANTARGPLLFVADSCWMAQSYAITGRRRGSGFLLPTIPLSGRYHRAAR